MRSLIYLLPDTHSALLSRAAGSVLVLMLVCAGPVAAQDAVMQKAVASYQSARFDQAIELFSEVAQNTSADIDDRREALQYLGQTYIAKRMGAQAKQTMEELVALEPPIIELNPDQVSPPLMNLYYQVRKEQSGGYEVERRDPGMKTLAIIDFTNSSIGDDYDRYGPLERGLPSMMINYLNGATDLKVVERERIQWLLDELKLQKDPGMVDQNTAVKAGKLLGANAVLIGAYTVAGSRMWMSARLVSVETGEILLAQQITGKPADFFDLVEDLSAKVATSIKSDLPKQMLGQERQTKSLDAVLSYSEGLALLEQQDYNGAYAKFQKAVELDPGYTRAKEKANSLMPMLAVR
ncbi:MAG TPA: CsgG/HfaB family protein [Rhodothermales bacterium]|nr:CsgG/HfaB family protein [Rhodothermales bacterium]